MLQDYQKIQAEELNENVMIGKMRTICKGYFSIYMLMRERVIIIKNEQDQASIAK